MRRAPVLAGALAVALAVALAGCGGDDLGDPEQRLSAASRALSTLRAGDVELRMALVPRGGAGDGRIGFALEGPVTVGAQGDPVADVRYTQTAGEQSATIRLVSTADRAFACAGGQQVALTAVQRDQLAAAVQPGGKGSGRGPLAAVDLQRWLDEPEVTEGEEVGGDPTVRITGRLKAGRVLRDLAQSLAKAADSEEAKAVADEDTDRLDDAVRTADLDVLVGKDDNLLRKLRLQVDVEVPERLRRTLGFEGARLDVVARIDRPNQPAERTPPESCP